MQIAALLMTKGIPLPRMSRAIATIAFDGLVNAPLMLASLILEDNQRDCFQRDAESSSEVERRSDAVEHDAGSIMTARTNGTASLVRVI